MSIFVYLKSKVSIVEVVSAYMTLKKLGGYWKGTCPFHDERTASFTVTPHREIFYCFGCHASGDVIGFIARVEHCSQFEAVMHLAERYSIDVPEQLLKYDKQKIDDTAQERKRYWQLFERVSMVLVEYYHAHQPVQHYAQGAINKRSSSKRVYAGVSTGRFRSFTTIYPYFAKPQFFIARFTKRSYCF